MTQSLLQEPVQSYEDSNGRPLNGGQLFTYDAGTLTPRATYQDAAGTIPNTNPIILNERGEAVVYGTGNYRMILKNSVGATIWDRDNVGSSANAAEQLRADLADPTDAALGDALVAVKQPVTGATARTQHDKNIERVSAFDFMTQAQRDDVRAGTLTLDVTTAMQTAITNVCNTGKLLVLPDGKYLMDGLTIDGRNGGGICAENPGGAIFVARSNSVNALTVANQQLGSPRRPFYIRGMGFDSNSKTGYTCVLSNDALQLNVLDIWTYQVDYVIKAFGVNGGGNSYAVNVDGVNQYGRGSWNFEGVGSNRIFQVNISNVNQFSVGASGWVAPWFRFRRAINVNMANVVSQALDGEAAGIVGLGAIEGLLLSNVIIVWPTDGITLAQDGDVSQPGYVYLNNVAVDQPSGIGINVAASVFKAVNTNVTFGKDRNNTGSGWVIQSTTTDWVMQGCTIRDNNKWGLTVQSGATNGMILGCYIKGNVFSGTGFDLDMAATAASDPVLIGNRIGTQSVSGPQYVNDGYTSNYLWVDRAQTATAANTTETTLSTYTMPANTFTGSMVLEAAASGMVGANATNKVIRFYIGGTLIGTISTNASGVAWRIQARIYRISNTQSWAEITTYAGTVVNVTSAIVTIDTTMNRDVAITGQNGTASANDIVKHHFDVQLVR